MIEIKVLKISTVKMEEEPKYDQLIRRNENRERTTDKNIEDKPGDEKY